MDDLTAQDSLELEVSNFGPIVQAKIDLRPLTVFIGPSNTGKSYLATLIYALHRYYCDTSSVNRRLHEGDARIPHFWHSVLSGNDVQDVAEWAEQTLIKSTDSSVEGRIYLSRSVMDIIRTVFDAQGDRVEFEMGRCFGTDKPSALIRRGSRSGARIALNKTLTNDSTSFLQELSLKVRGSHLRTLMPREETLRIDARAVRQWIGILHRMVDGLSEPYREGAELRLRALPLMNKILEATLPRLLGPLYRPAFYLPADRTGVMHSHQVVVGALVHNATTAGLRPTVDTPMLSGVFADFLQQLIQLKPLLYRRAKSHSDVSTHIEDAILGGSVQVENPQGINYPHFTYRPIGWKESLPLKNASSMVSELAPVVLYLRDVVEPGDTLIVEEPESHLHPAMQVEFTRQLAAVVQAGVRVIVTTHSEWVLEELANIVRRSELPESRRKEMPHGEFALSPEQVGAWLFKPKRRPKGSVVEEIRFDPDAGGLDSDFSEVARQLYNDWATIGNRIAGSTE